MIFRKSRFFDVLSKIIDFIKGNEKDFWFDLTSIQQDEIRTAIAQLDRGERTNWNEVRDQVA